jgi:hypothetical protein
LVLSSVNFTERRALKTGHSGGDLSLHFHALHA